MQNLVLGNMNALILHFVGNKNHEDGVRFSDVLTDFEDIEDYFKQMIDLNFKSEELYQFYFQPDVQLNPMYQFIGSIFKEKESFIEQSKNAGRYLYDKSVHPQIKGGELCMFYIKNCQLNGEKVDCVGIFKSENKDTILKIYDTQDGFGLKDEIGINTTKLDKGCLIFNTDKENGYIISVVDNTNKNAEAQYWKDEFLGVQPKKNEYHQTNQFLGIAKQFVTKKLLEDFEVSKADQIDLLNRSVEYFKNHETFEKTDFEVKVFQDHTIIDSFRNFDEGYRKDNEIEISNQFDISTQAVKKQARAFKSVLKLDKNFHIYIHGDKELIEQGVEKDGRKYYKIYYKDES
jgi:hypothetical protein